MKIFSFQFCKKDDINKYYKKIKSNNDNDMCVVINEDRLKGKKEADYEELFKKYAYSKNKYGLLVGDISDNKVTVGIELVIGYRSIVVNILKNRILGEQFPLNDIRLLNLSFIDQTVLDKYFKTYEVIEYDNIKDYYDILSNKYKDFYILYVKQDLFKNEKYLKHLKKYIKKTKNIHKFQKFKKHIVAGKGIDIYNYINSDKLPSNYHNIDMSIYELKLPSDDSFDIFIDESFDFLNL